VTAGTARPTLVVEVSTMTMAVIGGVLLLVLLAVAVFWPEPGGRRRAH